MFNIQEAVARAAAEGPNMNEATSGGDFERELPAAGLVRLRLVSYIELGQHVEEFKGEKKTRDKVALTFELSGPKHPMIKMGDKEVPQTITITETLSLSEKANFFKLFRRMNHTGQFRAMYEFLTADVGFLGTIVHKEVGEGADKKTYANLRDDAGYTIRPAFHEDLEGNTVAVPVDPPRTPLKLFLWNFATKEMWDSLFIDGKWDDKKDKDGKVIKEGTSKNYWQNRIKSALNFKGSTMAEILFAGGEPELPASEAPERNPEDVQAAAEAKAGASADPLAGV